MAAQRWIDSHAAAGILNTTPDFACVLAKKKLVLARKRGHIWEFADAELRAFAERHQEMTLRDLRTGR